MKTVDSLFKSIDFCIVKLKQKLAITALYMDDKWKPQGQSLGSILIYSLSLLLLLIFSCSISMSQKFNKTGPAYFVKQDKAVLSAFYREINNQQEVFLHLVELSSGNLLEKKLICKTEKFNPEQIIGKIDHLLWVYTDSLTAYDVNTLKPVITESIIASKNPVLLHNFSEFPNSYLIDESAGVLYLRTKNGDGYKLYQAELKLTDDNGPSDPPADKDYQYEFAAYYQVNDRYNFEYALSNVDTFQSKVYILGSVVETGHVTSYFGSQIYAPREEHRFVSVVPWKDIEKPGNHIKLTGAGQKKYFKGGFLAEKFFARAWRDSSNNHIILYDENAILQVAMINQDGKESWTTNSRLLWKNFTDYLVNDSCLIIWSSDKASDPTNSLVIIDLKTGKASTRSLGF